MEARLRRAGGVLLALLSGRSASSVASCASSPIWAVLASSVVYLAWWIVDGAHLGRMWTEGGHQGSFWLAVDTVVAVTVSWAPLVADYARFSRDRRSAFFGVGIGYLLPTFFQFGFGSILVLSRNIQPEHPELILTMIAGGGAAAAFALLALTVDETDEAFANVYSAAVSTQNLLPRAPQSRAHRRSRTARHRRRARAIDMRIYQRFLLLLGAVFVPLLGVLVADCCSPARANTRRQIFAARPCDRDRSPPGRRLRLYECLRDRRTSLLDALAQPPADTVVPDRRVDPELPHRLSPDGGHRQARLGPCFRSRSSGTSHAT